MKGKTEAEGADRISIWFICLYMLAMTSRLFPEFGIPDRVIYFLGIWWVMDTGVTLVVESYRK